MDPQYVAELLEKSGHGPTDEARAFLDSALSEDEVAEELGEGFIQSATSGENNDEALLDPDDRELQEGGPFVETSGREEYGRKPDASNPEDAEVEPFPRTQSEA